MPRVKLPGGQARNTGWATHAPPLGGQQFMDDTTQHQCVSICLQVFAACAGCHVLAVLWMEHGWVTYLGESGVQCESREPQGWVCFTVLFLPILMTVTMSQDGMGPDLR